MLLGADFGGLRIRVSVVRFRPWPPFIRKCLAGAQRVGVIHDLTPDHGEYRCRAWQMPKGDGKDVLRQNCKVGELTGLEASFFFLREFCIR